MTESSCDPSVFVAIPCGVIDPGPRGKSRAGRGDVAQIETIQFCGDSSVRMDILAVIRTVSVQWLRINREGMK